MSWIIPSLLAPLFYALVNHLDKHVISRIFHGGIGPALLYSSFIGFPISLIIAIIQPSVFHIDTQSALLVIIGGILIIASLPFYFSALLLYDASTVMPFSLLIPLFSLILSFVVLGERMSTFALIGGVILSFGIFILSRSQDALHSLRYTRKLIVLMSAASLCWALNGSIYKFFTLNHPYWTTQFWQYVGYGIAGTFIAMIKPQYFKEFINTYKNNKSWIIGLNLTNESLSTLGKLLADLASLMAPLATVSWVVQGFQPVFVFIISIAISKVAPQLEHENLHKKVLLRKALAISIMLLGLYLLNY